MDTRFINCTECGDAAVEVDAHLSADTLEGTPGSCENCGVGRLVGCDDEGQVWVELRPLPCNLTVNWVEQGGSYFPRDPSAYPLIILV